jgi:feruloyl esterase
MESNVLNGFAALSTDTGHLSAVFDASWALNKPESIIDWGYHALHEFVVLGKEVTEAYYNCQIQYSYYSGCSTGGRQGLKEVQMFPEDFDGVLTGAPAWWTSHLQTWSLETSKKPLFLSIKNQVTKADF